MSNQEKPAISRDGAAQALDRYFFTVRQTYEIDHILPDRDTQLKNVNPHKLEEIRDGSVLIGVAPSSAEYGEISEYEGMFNISMGVASYYLFGLADRSEEQILDNISLANKDGILGMISWAPEVDVDITTERLLPYMTRLATFLGKIGGSNIFRFFYDMNGSWFPKIQPDEFKKLWDQVYDVFQKEAPEVLLMFSPHYSASHVDQFADYFPGQDKVHLFGLNVVNNSNPTHVYNLHNSELSPSNLIGGDMALLQELGQENIPIILSELNSFRRDPAFTDWLVKVMNYGINCGAKAIIFCYRD